MEEIKNWGLLLLFISAGTLIYCFLMPSASVSKSVKSVISLVTVSVCIFPLFNVLEGFRNTDISFSEPPSVESLDEYIIQQVKTAAENTVRETVKKYTHVSYKTEIFVNKTENGSIDIEYVGIIFSAYPDREDELRKALYEALSIMPDIKVELLSE